MVDEAALVSLLLWEKGDRGAVDEDLCLTPLLLTFFLTNIKPSSSVGYADTFSHGRRLFLLPFLLGKAILNHHHLTNRRQPYIIIRKLKKKG